MTDKDQIVEKIQMYFDSMYESSSKKVYEIFDPNARIAGYLEDGFHEMTLKEFAALIASSQPSPKEKGDPIRLDILSIDIAGNIALAKVRDDYAGMTFLDMLSLVKKDEQWCIYNKIFQLESSSSPIDKK